MRELLKRDGSTITCNVHFCRRNSHICEVRFASTLACFHTDGTHAEICIQIMRSNKKYLLSQMRDANMIGKTRTRWKRKYPNIIGKRFFDGGEYGLGFFTVLKAWKCKEYCSSAEAPDGTRWFDKNMILIKTDSGIKYKIPYCPWVGVVDAKTGKYWSNYYNERPW